MIAQLIMSALGLQGIAPVELRVTDSMDPEIVALVREKYAAAAADPGNGELHFHLGLACEANTYWKEARESYTNALALIPEEFDARSRELKDAEWRFRLAVVEYRGGNLLASISDMQTVALVFRNTPVVQARLGGMLFRTGDLAGASAAWEQAIKAEAKGGGPYPASRIGLSRVRLDQERLGEALALAEEALAINVNFRPAHYQLGLCLTELGRHEEAEVAFARGLDANPSMPPDPHFLLLEDYAVGYANRMRRVEENLIARRIAPALAILDRVEERRPNDPMARALRAKAHFMLGPGGREKALIFYAEAEALDPTMHSVKTEHAICLLNALRFEEAIKKADEAVALVPTSGSAHYFAGLARFYEAGRLASEGGDEQHVAALKRDSLREFEAAMKHGVQEANALLQVAQLLGEAGDLESMLRYAEAYARRQPAAPDAHLSVCQVQLTLFRVMPDAARLDVAEAALERALKYGPGDARVQALAPQLRDALRRARAWLESQPK